MSFFQWCNRTFRWSNSRQSWQERLSFLGLAAIAVVLWNITPSGTGTGTSWLQMHPVFLVLGWGIWVLAASILFRRGWIKLFGPVLFYDIIRSARRGRYILLRCLYALLLFGLLSSVFLSYSNSYYYNSGSSQQRAAQLAQNYFEMFMVIQFVAVLILTPVYVAGSIADEKRRRTLEYLLATDLRNREIVLSKLGARLLNLTVFVLTGLPLLSMVQFIGGVSPELILSGFAVTGLTMFGLAGVGIACSTYYTRPRDAIALTYLLAVLYYGLSFFLYFMQFWFSSILGNEIFSFTFNGVLYELTVDDLFIWISPFNSGNLILLLANVQQAGFSGTLATMLPTLLRDYAIFNGLVGGWCIFWSIWRLRAIARKQVGRVRKRRQIKGLFYIPRPKIGNLPMMWKELHVEGGLKFRWIGWVVVVLLTILTYVPVVLIVYFIFFTRGGYYGDPWRELSEGTNVWVRTTTVIISCLTLLTVATRASTSISSERDKDTLDSLLTTTLDSNEILAAKWLGSIASIRFAWLWLGSIWLIAVCTGGLSILALPFLIAAWLIFSGFVGILGCWFSMVSKTSMRATVFTLLTTAMLGVGHWLPWFCCAFGPGPGREAEYLVKFQAGLTPPAAMGILPFYSGNFRYDHMAEEFLELFCFCLVGFFFWLFATLIVWVMASTRFRELTHRGARINPDNRITRGRTF